MTKGSFILYAKKISAARLTNAVLVVILLVIIIIMRLYAATPNPGHPWLEVGDGQWAATGTTAYHTYTFPDATATVMTTLDIDPGDIIYGSAASTTTTLAKDTNATRYLSNTGVNNNPLWALVNLANGITGTLGSANGGTGSAFFGISGPTALRTYALPDANATVLTSNAAVTVAQGGTGLQTLTANNLLVGAGTSNVSFVAPGANGSLLISNGTTWTPVTSTSTTSAVMPLAGATGALLASTTASLTAYRVGMFTLPNQITVRSAAISIGGTVGTAGTMKMCVYKEDGTKVLDFTSTTTMTINSSLTVGTTSSTTLYPGKYYFATGCATTCSATINYWVTTTATPFTTLTPSGKKVYEGLVTMTSGTCNVTLPAITAAISSTPVARLDN